MYLAGYLSTLYVNKAHNYVNLAVGLVHVLYFSALCKPSKTSISLLTPMDHATLVNAKSTITHCPPSLISRQRASVVSKLNNNAQTPLGRFVVYTLYNELCNKYICDKSNR